MSELRRRLSWYKRWMGDGEDEREELAQTLRHAIHESRDDLQTNLELLDLLNYKLLHQLQSQNDVSAREGAFASDYDPIVSQIQGTEDMLSCLLDRLKRLDNISNPGQRCEIQYRCVLSCLQLLRSHGNGSLPERIQNTVSYDCDQLRSESFLDTLRPDFRIQTTDDYRLIQNSFLLTIAVANCSPSQATLPDVRRPMQTCLSSLDPGSFDVYLRRFEEHLGQLWTEPAVDLEALLFMQEACTLASAYHLFASVSDGLRSNSRLISQSDRLANVLLGKLCHLLSQTISIPLGLDGGSQSTNAGLYDFTYFYGLLDLASRLATALPYPSAATRRLIDILRNIVVNSRVSIYRCKSIEVVLRLDKKLHAAPDPDASAFSELFSRLSNTDRDRLNQEAQVVFDDLENFSNTTLRRRNTLALTFRPRRISVVPSDYSVELSDWQEPSFFATPRSRGINEVCVNLTTNSWYRKALRCPERFITSGLDPQCHYAFLLNEESLKIFSLRALSDDGSVGHTCLQADIKIPDSDVADAVISGSYAAIISNTKLVVYEYGFGIPKEGKKLGEQRFATTHNRTWDPHCITMHEDRDHVWIAVGERLLIDDDFCAAIDIYHIDKTSRTPLLEPLCATFVGANPDPIRGDYLKGDYFKMLAYNADGSKLTAVTINNRLLVWPISQHGLPLGAPFQAQRYYTFATNSYGMMSATPFKSPSGRDYVLCLTSPSSERASIGGYGEWTSIFPLPAAPSRVPQELTHNISHLRDAVLVGTATSRGDLIAVREWDGRIRVQPLNAPLPGQRSGGLRCDERPVTLANRLCGQRRAGPTSIRFEESRRGLFVVAVDVEGRLIRRLWAREGERDPPLGNGIGGGGPPCEVEDTELRFEMPG